MEPLATDRQLVEAARQGDLEAFTRLVEREMDPLVNYLTYLTGSIDRAEDLAQEAFLRFFQMLDRYEERGRLRSLIFQIATNQLRNEERRKRRWQRIVPFLRNGHTQEPGIQTRMLHNELLEKLSETLEDLPLHYRAPLVLFEIQGWSYEEIARHLRCREGTVKSRIHRGRAKVRDRLETYLEGRSS